MGPADFSQTLATGLRRGDPATLPHRDSGRTTLGLLLFLAVWAILRAAAGHDVALNGRAATRARRARFAEHAQLLLVAAQLSPGGAVVAE